VNNGAWQSHEEACECVGCQFDRDMQQLTSELLPETNQPTPPSRIWPWVKELLAWVVVVAIIMVMVRCHE
jgi:hypothetical protein